MKFGNYLDIDGKQLHLLVTIFDAGSLSQAARLLDVNQSTLSYWLESLRTQFNDPLFIRSGQGVIPTERAELLVPQAREILVSLSEFSQVAQYHPENDTSQLIIAANALERDLIVKPLLKRIRELAPHLRLTIKTTGSSFELVKDLTDGNVELALLPTGILDGDNIVQKGLMPIEFSVFYDATMTSEPVDIDDFCVRPHGVVSLGPDPSSTIDVALRKLGKKRKISIDAPDFDTLATLMKGTDVIASLPNLLKLSAFKQFSIAPLPWYSSKNRIALFWHVKKTNSVRLRFWRQEIESIANSIDITKAQLT
ncbi:MULTISPECIES: LysR family transcriptional regulator [Pseudomonadati]|uniref:LysR family transcriptional regulator n=1 Tax=Shewanella aestuarii TaxID=1028752 RepID=A0ABT0KWZ1_9GAMM|nr:LysR family transcriptional regulator [Shewanella aestuarii]MCL1115979.1 LysR family transcriptional regulator [Shewanella aestuarii]GGN69801.1 LysR family transcriptional regulator [Shewanella aestuarii]